MSHMNESRHMWISHGTHECVTAHISRAWIQVFSVLLQCGSGCCCSVFCCSVLQDADSAVGISDVCRTNESVWVKLHLWMSHVTRMTESCHTYEWVMSCMFLMHVIRTSQYESNHTYELAMLHSWTSHITHINESHVQMSHTYEWVTRKNKSCHPYEWVMSRQGAVLGVSISDSRPAGTALHESRAHVSRIHLAPFVDHEDSACLESPLLWLELSIDQNYPLIWINKKRRPHTDTLNHAWHTLYNIVTIQFFLYRKKTGNQCGGVCVRCGVTWSVCEM